MRLLVQARLTALSWKGASLAARLWTGSPSKKARQDRAKPKNALFANLPLQI
jgi:hypothetical protein